MATDTAPTTFWFAGFQYPTTTPVPDEVFDVLAPQLSEAELRVLLYIIRRTFGFKKQKDPISLTQLVEGIKTKDGNVLDLGTGMSRRGVMKGCQGLVKKGVISVEKRLSDQGDYAVNIYSLRFQDGREVGNNVPYGREPSTIPVGNQVALQQTVIQETEKQETAIVVATATELENFGIAKSAAAKLIKHYPVPYIQEKLAMAQELVTTGSDLVSQNPAGWLRRAIEEDYQPVSIPPRQRKSSVRKNTEKRTMHRKSGFQRTSNVQTFPKEVSQRAQNVPTEQREPENINRPTPEERRANEAMWQNVVEQVTRSLLLGESAARLIGTTLLQVTETAAWISVANPSAIPWLERRLYGHIQQAMKHVLGRDVDLQFVTSPS
jgi:Bacteriophage replication protein O